MGGGGEGRKNYFFVFHFLLQKNIISDIRLLFMWNDIKSRNEWHVLFSCCCCCCCLMVESQKTVYKIVFLKIEANLLLLLLFFFLINFKLKSDNQRYRCINWCGKKRVASLLVVDFLLNKKNNR